MAQNEQELNKKTKKSKQIDVIISRLNEEICAKYLLPNKTSQNSPTSHVLTFSVYLQLNQQMIRFKNTKLMLINSLFTFGAN